MRGCGGVPAIFFLDVLDCATAFDAADGETGAVGKAAHHAGLPFQWALHGFVELGGFVEVDDVDVAVRGCDDQKLVDDIHAVDPFLTSDGGHRGRLSHVPIFDSFVPGARDQNRGCLAGHFDEAYAANRLVVGGDL